MITVSISLSSKGVIDQLLAEGHAGFSLRGSDIVCSAFTILLRTFARTIEAASGVDWSVRADSPGRFHLAVSGVSPEIADHYRGWCEFVLRGFEDLSREHPGAVRIQYGSDSGRLFHGS